MPQVVDVGLENLSSAPPKVLECVFWETEQKDPTDPRFHKEEWFSSTLLEWGVCGKLMVDGDEVVAFAQFAPPSLFPRVARYRAGRVSPDAVYLAYCYVASGHRGRGLGSQMIRAVARDLVDRGFRAMESLGQSEWEGGWVLPEAFLAANRFAVVRPDPMVPLMRLELFGVTTPAEARAAEALPLPR
ncbi:MAG TPA: GNAT family N-acetyltransferase [Actinomycetota bacterium]